MKLLSAAIDNTKLRKSETADFAVVGLTLPSHTIGAQKGEKSACPESIASCRALCVVSQAGLVVMFRQRIEGGRIAKRQFLHSDRPGFIAHLKAEIALEEVKASQQERQLVCRLNVGTDFCWFSKDYGEIPQSMPSVLFYDYTRVHSRLQENPAENYTLVASWDESPRHQKSALALLEAGYNVSVCFADITPLSGDGSVNRFSGSAALRQRLPKTWVLPGSTRSHSVSDGDISDLRLSQAGDPVPTKAGRGSIIGLRLKSFSHDIRANAIASGFPQLVDWTGKQ